MSSIRGDNVTFLGVRNNWVNTNQASIYSSRLSDPGSTNISFSEFRGATFSDGTSIPTSGEISMSDIIGKTFSNIYNTDKFSVYSEWSAYSDKLVGTTAGYAIYSGSTLANKRIQLISGQSSNYPYSIILLTPNAASSSTSPGLITDRSSTSSVDEATVWFKVIDHNLYSQLQFGIVKKDYNLTWTEMLPYLNDKHATYTDRMAFHGLGFHNYAGSRDDITSSSTIVSPQYKSGTYGSNLTSNFHNRIGATSGTMRSVNAASTPVGISDMYFFKNTTEQYNTYRSGILNPSHGMKIKWYETTIQADLVSGSSIITPVGATWSSSSTPQSSDDLFNVYSGMYISGTGIPTANGAFIGKIYTDSIQMYREKSVTTLTTLDATSNQTNVTLTISGYLYWTLTTGSSSTHTSAADDSVYINQKIFGPPHTVLPRYQSDSSGSTTNYDTTEWAFYIGDTTNATTNTLNYDIRDTEPGGTAFSYLVSYGLEPDIDYEFGIMTTSNYVISGSLSSITPDLSGYAYTANINSNVNWKTYSMGSRFKFINAGDIVAVGVQNRYGGKISVFTDTGTTALETVDVAGTESTSTTINYRYTTLTTPISVSANSIYRIIFKNTTGGYSYHDMSAYDLTNTTSGNIQLQGAGFISTASAATAPVTTTNNYVTGYGATDLIFSPSV